MLWIEIAILALLFVLICLFVYSYIKITNKLAEILLYVKENYVSKKPADNPRYVKVTLFGVHYKSIDEAANALGIPQVNLRRWLKNKDLKTVEKLVKDYQNGIKNNPVAPSKFIIDGKEFSNKTEVAKKLGVKMHTFCNWYSQGILTEKLNEYGIDYKKILGIEDKPVKKENGYNAVTQCRNRVRITNNILPKYRIKYSNIKPGDEFDSYQQLADYIGCTVGIVYDWVKKGYAEVIK